MNLEFEFVLTGKLKPAVRFGNGPIGARVFFEVLSGTVEGKRLKGNVLPGGGDWILVCADGFARLDVRIQLVTHDGAFVYALYPGLLERNEKVTRAATAGSGTEYDDQYFRITPRFETGDERYSWLNQSLFIGEGHLIPGGVEYKVYRVT
jgi:hypothetical protein